MILRHVLLLRYIVEKWFLINWVCYLSFRDSYRLIMSFYNICPHNQIRPHVEKEHICYIHKGTFNATYQITPTKHMVLIIDRTTKIILNICGSDRRHKLIHYPCIYFFFFFWKRSHISQNDKHIFPHLVTWKEKKKKKKSF